MALGVEEQVTRLEIPVQQIRRVHILETLKVLVNDVLLVDVLKNVRTNYRVQVSIHEVKHEVDISIVLSSDHILQPDYVFMPRELLKKDNLTEGTLCISRILEGIEVFLQCNYLLSSLVDRFPNDTVGSFPYINRQKQSHKLNARKCHFAYLAFGEFRIFLARVLRFLLSFLAARFALESFF